MKDSYPDWPALKKDAALVKAEDVSRDRDSATVVIKIDGKPTTINFKRVDNVWQKIR